MYTTKTIQEINPSEWPGYRLCYIDSISETTLDYTRDDYEALGRTSLTWGSSEWGSCRLVEQPNPEYIEGQQELYAYFTPLPLSKQWGDDWNDAPYECNAGAPYDHGDNADAVEILVVPFAVSGAWDIVKEPKDWGGINSPWSIEDINKGIIPWLYLENGDKKWRIIRAGTRIGDFMEGIKNDTERS
jgi:hypothetical protein